MFRTIACALGLHKWSHEREGTFWGPRFIKPLFGRMECVHCGEIWDEEEA